MPFVPNPQLLNTKKTLKIQFIYSNSIFHCHKQNYLISCVVSVVRLRSQAEIFPDFVSEVLASRIVGNSNQKSSKMHLK